MVRMTAALTPSGWLCPKPKEVTKRTALDSQALGHGIAVWNATALVNYIMLDKAIVNHPKICHKSVV